LKQISSNQRIEILSYLNLLYLCWAQAEQLSLCYPEMGDLHVVIQKVKELVGYYKLFTNITNEEVANAGRK
jgi:hypothetical protein